MTVRRGSATHPLRVLFQDGALGAWSDDELLERYLTGEAEASERAFSVLVERHGPMVRHVCSAILKDPEETADAFQATFLVLAKRAGSIRRAESVGPWLFGVARRLASRARVEAAKRRRLERAHAERREAAAMASDHDGDRPEDWATLYEELDRLPNRYRDPIVLCHLEGLSHEQAAARIGCPLGTLRTRLQRGRDRLRGRLTRRGLKPIGAGASALVLASSVAPASRAEVPVSWITAAGRLAASTRPIAAAAPPVSALATPLLRSFTMFTLVRGLFALGGSGLLVGFGLSSVGLGPFSGATGDSEQPPNPSASRPEPDPPSGALPLASQDPEPDEPETPDANSDDSTPRIQVFTCPPSTEGATIEYLVPNGQRVEKGELLCRLSGDEKPPDLERLAHERRRAWLEHEIAELDARAAFFQTREREMSHEIESRALRSEYQVASERRILAALKLERAKELHQRGKLDEVELQFARVEDTRAAAELDRVEIEMELAEQVGELRTERAQMRYQQAQKRAALAEQEAEWHTHRLERSRKAIKRLQFTAPFDSVVEYPETIQPGAQVEGGQMILRCAPLPADGEDEELSPDPSSP